MQLRFVSQYQLSNYDAEVLTAERSTAQFFDEVVKNGADPKRACNLITQVGLKLAKEAVMPLGELGLAAEQVAELAKLAESGQVNATAANNILEQMLKTGKSAQKLAEELNLLQESDVEEIKAVVLEVLAENSQAVEDVKKNPKKSQKAKGFLLGQVMQKTKGRANPKLVSQILDENLT